MSIADIEKDLELNQKPPLERAWLLTQVVHRLDHRREKKKKLYGKRNPTKILEDGFHTCSSDMVRTISTFLNRQNIKTRYIEAYRGPENGWKDRKHSTYLVLVLDDKKPILNPYAKTLIPNPGENVPIYTSKLIEAENFEQTGIENYEDLKRLN